MVHEKLTWKFNPPGSPHQGGFWEQLVRSCKRVFYAILDNRKLNEDVLLTTFCLVQRTLNARLLAPVSSNPNDFARTISCLADPVHACFQQTELSMILTIGNALLAHKRLQTPSGPVGFRNTFQC